MVLVRLMLPSSLTTPPLGLFTTVLLTRRMPRPTTAGKFCRFRVMMLFATVRSSRLMQSSPLQLCTAARLLEKMLVLTT